MMSNNLEALYTELGYLEDEEEELRRQLSGVLRDIDKIQRTIQVLEGEVDVTPEDYGMW